MPKATEKKKGVTKQPATKRKAADPDPTYVPDSPDQWASTIDPDSPVR